MATSQFSSIKKKKKKNLKSQLNPKKTLLFPLFLHTKKQTKKMSVQYYGEWMNEWMKECHIIWQILGWNE